MFIGDKIRCHQQRYCTVQRVTQRDPEPRRAGVYGVRSAPGHNRAGARAIRAARAASDIRIDIEDQGPGVAEELREAIFERFHTLRPASEPFGTHSGLGLSISRQITDAHGGTITCTNRQTEDGNVEGARFTVRLPVAADGEK